MNLVKHVLDVRLYCCCWASDLKIHNLQFHSIKTLVTQQTHSSLKPDSKVANQETPLQKAKLIKEAPITTST